VESSKNIQYRQYALDVLQRIERGRQDVKAGRVISQAEVESRMARGLDSDFLAKQVQSTDAREGDQGHCVADDHAESGLS